MHYNFKIYFYWDVFDEKFLINHFSDLQYHLQFHQCEHKNFIREQHHCRDLVINNLIKLD